MIRLPKELSIMMMKFFLKTSVLRITDNKLKSDL